MKNIHADLKSLIYKTAIAKRQVAEDVDLSEFDADDVVIDELLIGEAALISSVSSVEVKSAAKIWMAAVKFVTPAVTVGIAITPDISKVDPLGIAAAILEQSTISAFANVVDAYSCGANFTPDNIFGLYRYSLSNSANCTSYLTYVHKKVISDFGKVMTAHLCEMATGVKPISNRSLPEGDTNSFVSTGPNRDLLKQYLDSTYPSTEIDHSTSISVSLLNALTKCTSSYMTRTKTRPVTKRMQEILESSFIDNLESWLHSTSRATNGNILKGTDEHSRAMVAQNAINMISAIASCATDKLLHLDVSTIYSPNITTDIKSLSNVLISRVIGKTNAYASLFSKNGQKVFDAIEEAALPYSRGSSKSPLTPQAWLSLFELPTKLCRFLTYEIAQEVVDSANINASFEKILIEGLLLGQTLRSSLKVHEEWAIKPLSIDALAYVGEMSCRGIENYHLDCDAINKIVEEVVDIGLDLGYKNIASQNGRKSIDPISAIRVSIAGGAVKLATALTGTVNSKDKYQLILLLSKFAIDKTINSYKDLGHSKNMDGSVMMFGALYNNVVQLISDNLRYELHSNLSSSQVCLITDYLSGYSVKLRIESAVAASTQMICEVVNHGTKRVQMVTLEETAVKKSDAAQSLTTAAALKL